jgi:hypothetical protein
VIPEFSAEAALRRDLPWTVARPLSTGRLPARNLPGGAATIGPAHETEPRTTGRAAWAALAKACETLQCRSCRADCHRFVNGLHDAINVKLRKPTEREADFAYLRDFVVSMHNEATASSARSRVGEVQFKRQEAAQASKSR